MSKTGDKNLRIYEDDHDAIKHMAVDCGVSVKKFVGIMIAAVKGHEYHNIQNNLSKASRVNNINTNKRKIFENSLPSELQSIIYGEGKKKCPS